MKNLEAAAKCMPRIIIECKVAKGGSRRAAVLGGRWQATCELLLRVGQCPAHGARWEWL